MDAFATTVKTCGFIGLIFMMALVLSHLLVLTGVTTGLTEYFVSLPVLPYAIIVAIQITYLILGCFIDPTPIIILTIPTFYPLVMALGFDPIWFGIVATINMEMACITPPVGFNLYVMRGVAPPEVTMGDIILGSAPFVIIDAIVLAMVVIFPQIALWLPSTIYTM